VSLCVLEFLSDWRSSLWFVNYHHQSTPAVLHV